MSTHSCPHCGGPFTIALAAEAPDPILDTLITLARAAAVRDGDIPILPVPMIPHWSAREPIESEFVWVQYGNGEPEVLAPWCIASLEPDRFETLSGVSMQDIERHAFLRHEVDRKTGFNRLELVAEYNARIEAEQRADPSAPELILHRRARARPLGAGLPRDRHAAQPAASV